MVLMLKLMPMINNNNRTGCCAHTPQQCNGSHRPGAEGIRQRLLARLRLACQGTLAIWLASQVTLSSWATLPITVPCWQSACYLLT